MNRKAILCAVALGAGFSYCTPISGWADDSAASIAAGGLVPRRETRIVMAKEVLRISTKKVVVDYDFRNDTDQDVTTEVAFPVPPYENDFPEGSASEQSFKSFRLWVDGKPIHYEAEAKAFLKGRNVTGILEQNHIDIPTFGHFDDTSNSGQITVRDFSRLPKTEQTRLIKDGLFEDQGGGRILSLYTVHLQYHWTQSFPAHKTVHIRHEYSPYAGFTTLYGKYAEQQLLEAGNLPVNEATPKPLDPEDRGDITSFCLGLPLAKSMAASLHRQLLDNSSQEDSSGMVGMQWVDFILTSANTWQRPIEDFTLIVERPREEHGAKTLVSFCSPQDAKVEKLDANHFQVHLTNFVPTAELHIGFFDLPEAKPAK